MIQKQKLELNQMWVVSVIHLHCILQLLDSNSYCRSFKRVLSISILVSFVCCKQRTNKKKTPNIECAAYRNNKFYCNDCIFIVCSIY